MDVEKLKAGDSLEWGRVIECDAAFLDKNMETWKVSSIQWPCGAPLNLSHGGITLKSGNKGWQLSFAAFIDEFLETPNKMDVETTGFDCGKLLAGDREEWDLIDFHDNRMGEIQKRIIDTNGDEWAVSRSFRIRFSNNSINISDSMLDMLRQRDGHSWNGSYRKFIADFCKHSPGKDENESLREQVKCLSEFSAASHEAINRLFPRLRGSGDTLLSKVNNLANSYEGSCHDTRNAIEQRDATRDELKAANESIVDQAKNIEHLIAESVRTTDKLAEDASARRLHKSISNDLRNQRDEACEELKTLQAAWDANQATYSEPVGWQGVVRKCADALLTADCLYGYQSDNYGHIRNTPNAFLGYAKKRAREITELTDRAEIAENTTAAMEDAMRLKVVELGERRKDVKHLKHENGRLNEIVRQYEGPYPRYWPNIVEKCAEALAASGNDIADAKTWRQYKRHVERIGRIFHNSQPPVFKKTLEGKEVSR